MGWGVATFFVFVLTKQRPSSQNCNAPWVNSIKWFENTVVQNGKSLFTPRWNLLKKTGFILDIWPEPAIGISSCPKQASRYKKNGPVSRYLKKKNAQESAKGGFEWHIARSFPYPLWGSMQEFPPLCATDQHAQSQLFYKLLYILYYMYIIYMYWVVEFTAWAFPSEAVQISECRYKKGGSKELIWHFRILCSSGLFLSVSDWLIEVLK